MSDTLSDLILFAYGFAVGGFFATVVVWKITLIGFRKVIEQAIRQGYFRLDGHRYNVTSQTVKGDQT